MSDIKIFVSHRINIDSETIDNPLYVNVRCGAVFDEREGITMQGDDTGDHISEKRDSFCEFTVQYWAWKNAEADYYGLCHYRRYLSFAEKQYRTNPYHHMVDHPFLTSAKKVRYGLTNMQAMARLISDYDVVVSQGSQVRKTPSPKGRIKSVRELWEAYTGLFFETPPIDSLLELIDSMSPQYSQSAREYIEGGCHRGYNCYILKKELFYRLCEFQFPILFELERRLDTANYTQMMRRTPGYIGEILYGIFIYHITAHEQHRVKELQLVFFENTQRQPGGLVELLGYLWFGIDHALRFIINPFFPLGSKRREFIKRLLFLNRCMGL